MNLEYLYQDAVFVMECGEYNPQTKVYQAARKVLFECGEKLCSQCKKVKPLDDFYPSKSPLTPDGLQSCCKKCNTVQVRSYRREKHRAMMDSLPEFMQREQTLYRLYSDDDTLLYVGIAWNVRNRFNSHKADKVWWDDVARYELETYPNRAAVLQAEELAIKTEFPIYNKVHKM